MFYVYRYEGDGTRNWTGFYAARDRAVFMARRQCTFGAETAHVVEVGVGEVYCAVRDPKNDADSAEYELGPPW